MFSEPVVNVLGYSALAALLTAFGALPFARRPAVGRRLVGPAVAFAAGLMLGAAYLLLLQGLDRSVLAAIGGAGLGVGYTLFTQWYAETQELESDHDSPTYGYRLLLQNTLHSASEGVAIGVAMIVDLRLGIFVALALGLHNVAEGLAISDVLGRRDMPLHQAAALCVVAKSSQPLFALALFALAPILGGILPGALGFAAGALAFLVLTELLPDAYDRASHEAVASVTSLAAALIVLLENFLV